MTDTYQGACYCGAIALKVTGAAVAEGFCHCNSCQTWSAAPMIPYMLFPDAAVEVTQGEAHLRTINKSGTGVRAHCGKCGGGVLPRSTGPG